MEDKSPAEQIDAIILKSNDWRGDTLTKLRGMITSVDPLIIEEVKWKKPSKPEGVAVWSRDGIVCIGETLKSAVRLTFPKGALLADSSKLFNSRLDSNAVRAIDFHEDETIDAEAFKALVQAGIKLNVLNKQAR